MSIKCILWSVTLISACAGSPREVESPGATGDVYEVVNNSDCTARILLHNLDGQAITHIKFEDLPAGSTARYRLPSPAIKLTALAVDALRNSCGMAANEKIKVTIVK